MNSRRDFFNKALLASSFVGLTAIHLKADMGNMIEDTNSIELEFEEIFSHFLSEVEKESKAISSKDKALAILASLIATQSGFYKEFLRDSLKADLSPIEAREVLYQSVAYVGFGKAYEFFNLTNEVFKKEGVKMPLKKGGVSTKQNRQRLGYELQIQTFGKRIENAYKNANEDTKHINHFLSANCFGDYYTRKGLDMRQRELITFAILASLGGCENQLRGHTQGNLNVGNDRAKLIATITALVPYIGYPRTLNALNIINETTNARRAE